jgi:hypothetical protein
VTAAVGACTESVHRFNGDDITCACGTTSRTRQADEQTLLAMEERIGEKVRRLIDVGDRHPTRRDADVEDVLELAAEYANATADARLRWRMATAAEAAARAFERCPICNGLGVVPFDPATPTSTTTASTGPWTCPTCSGVRVIAMPEARPQ